MTEQEAIKRMKYRIETATEIIGKGVDGKAFEDMEMAIEALEKQIPKKPNIWENKSIDSPIPNDDWGYECPCCGNRDIDYPEHHCECGQKLDWEEGGTSD